jgi:DNA-binding transcriptional ArsR family regulator
MRAMAHPARLAILDHLGLVPDATATECAQVIGLSPSATSYHLRELAKVGLIEEAPSRGDGRERVWRESGGGVRVEADDQASPEALTAATELVDVVMAWDRDRTMQWLRTASTEPKEWYDAAAVTRAQLWLTAAELAELVRTVDQYVRRYGRTERPQIPDGARRVAVLFSAVPSD